MSRLPDLLHASPAWTGAILPTILLTSVVVALSPLPADAQLSYDRTTFIHGFASSPGIWTTPYPEIGNLTTPRYLAQQVVLGTVDAPDLNLFLPAIGAASQESNFRSFLANANSSATHRHVFVGHSMGALIARYNYVAYSDMRSYYAGEIALDSPLSGALVANNRVAVASYLMDLQRRLNDAMNTWETHVAEKIWGSVDLPEFLLSRPVDASTTGPFIGLDVGKGMLAYATHILNGNDGAAVTRASDLLSLPALADLTTTSTFVTQLEGSSADNVIPRVSISSSIDHRDAILRLKSDFDGSDFRNNRTLYHRGMVLFAVCKVTGYVTVVTFHTGRTCGWAERALGRLNSRWTLYTTGAEDRLGGLVQSGISFDGLVTIANEHFPGPNAQTYDPAPLPDVSHMEVYRKPAALDLTVAEMYAIGMKKYTPPPPPLSLTVYGPSLVRPNALCSFQAAVDGGTPPYAYTWSGPGAPEGDPSMFDAASPGDFTVAVTITDKAGLRASTSMSVATSSAAPVCLAS